MSHGFTKRRNPVTLRISQELAPYFNFQSLTQELIEFYETQGYLSISQILTDKGLDLFREQCVTAWNAEKKGYNDKATWLENSLLPDIHHQAAIVRDYYFRGPLVDVAEQLIGPNIKGATSQLTFKMRGNTKPFAWHQDNGYGELDPYNAISTLTAMDDADEKNGCLWLIPASHQQGQIKLKYGKDDISQSKAIELQVDESRAIPMPMKAGDCLIFSCWMLHKSDGNYAKDRDRRILYLRYADADAVEVYNNNQPRPGRLLRGQTKDDQVCQFEQELE
jgi:hypothetical protein